MRTGAISSTVASKSPERYSKTKRSPCWAPTSSRALHPISEVNYKCNLSANGADKQLI